MLEFLSNKGEVINPGNHEQMVYNYNKKLIKVRESRIKEWDFYQFQNDNHVFQITIGHASLFTSLGFSIINIKTSKRIDYTKLLLHTKNDIVYEKDPSQDHILEYKSKGFEISFKAENSIKRLFCKGLNKQLGEFEFVAEFPYKKENEKMVILIPFEEDKKKFYLNYKENYYHAKISFKSEVFSITYDDINGLLDSGRGYWPYSHSWYWGSGSIILDNHQIGWNLGFGFGDLSNGNENYFFFDGKAHKIEIDFDVDNHPNGDLVIESKDKSFHIDLKYYYNNHTQTKVLWIDNKCDQVFYKTSGYVVVDNKKYEFKDEISFLEHANNHW